MSATASQSSSLSTEDLAEIVRSAIENVRPEIRKEVEYAIDLAILNYTEKLLLDALSEVENLSLS